MTTDTNSQLRRHRSRGYLLLWLFGLSAAALSVAWPLWPRGGPAGPRDETAGTRPWSFFEQSFDAPGIRRPATLSAGQAGAMVTDEPVIGVTAGGRHRAYLVRALSLGAKSHIVNDVVGGVPISVTYCDIYTCTRLFTAAASAGPLDLSQGGLKSGGMVLKSGGHPYRQDSGAPLDEEAPPFPYDSYQGDETTWGSWRQEHPDTDVYVGDAPILAPPPYEAPSIDEIPQSRRTVKTSPIATFITSFVYIGTAPFLILFVTLLIHVLLAFLLSPRRSPPSERNSSVST